MKMNTARLFFILLLTLNLKLRKCVVVPPENETIIDHEIGHFFEKTSLTITKSNALDHVIPKQIRPIRAESTDTSIPDRLNSLGITEDSSDKVFGELFNPQKQNPHHPSNLLEADNKQKQSFIARPIEQVVAKVQQMKAAKRKRKKIVSAEEKSEEGAEHSSSSRSSSRSDTDARSTRFLRGFEGIEVPEEENQREELIARSREEGVEGREESVTSRGRSKSGIGKKGGRSSRRKKGSALGGRGDSGIGNRLENKNSEGSRLAKTVDRIIVESDRYHMWWTGPMPETTDNPHFFSPEKWSAAHRPNQHAVFTVAYQQGQADQITCSYPNQLILYLGSLRKYFTGDVVMAIDIDLLHEQTKQILQYYQVIVYPLQKDLCSKQSQFIYCGSEEERVPMTAFRYYFYEKWLLQYNTSSSLILFSDFRDTIFQSNPFDYQLSEWYPSYSIAVFQEFYPNMIIQNCVFNKRILQECYGNEMVRVIGSKVIISSGAMIGTRDGMLVLANSMTKQLQAAPGRMVDTRCSSGGIEHSFINYLIYYSKLKNLIRIKLFHHGEGPVNTVGGLQPNTVQGNITGSLQSFWHLLTKDGVVLNWNGEPSPVVHQLDHFSNELLALADQVEVANEINPRMTVTKEQLQEMNRSYDYMWQAIRSTRCLFDCKDSKDFTAAGK